MHIHELAGSYAGVEFPDIRANECHQMRSKRLRIAFLQQSSVQNACAAWHWIEIYAHNVRTY
jgi:hypothetical protein